MRPGSQWLVQIGDSDKRVVQALPVTGGQVSLPRTIVADDVDGADKSKASLAKAKLAA